MGGYGVHPCRQAIAEADDPLVGAGTLIAIAILEPGLSRPRPAPQPTRRGRPPPAPRPARRGRPRSDPSRHTTGSRPREARPRLTSSAARCRDRASTPRGRARGRARGPHLRDPYRPDPYGPHLRDPDHLRDRYDPRGPSWALAERRASALDGHQHAVAHRRHSGGQPWVRKQPLIERTRGGDLLC